jgi:hypothetical protein
LQRLRNDISDAQPDCSDNFTGKNLQQNEEFNKVYVQCFVTYTGNWRPVFNCQPGKGSSFVIFLNNVKTVVYYHSINVSRQLGLHNVSVSCHLSYKNGTPQSNSTTLATIEGHQYLWRSKPITIKCKFNHSSNSICKLSKFTCMLYHRIMSY